MSQLIFSRTAHIAFALALISSNALLAPTSSATTSAAPTVAITSPAPGSTQSGSVTVSGLALPDPLRSARVTDLGVQIRSLTGNVPSSGMSFSPSANCGGDVYNIGQMASSAVFGNFGNVFAAWGFPYDPNCDGKFLLKFDTTSWENGTYQLTLLVKDSTGLAAASEPIQFTTTSAAPTVAITSLVAESTRVDWFTLTGMATSDPSGTSKITMVGIKVVPQSDIPRTPFTVNFYWPEYDFYTANQSVLDFGAQGMATTAWYVYPFDGKIEITIPTTNWPISSYAVTLLAKDSSGRTASSAPANLTIPRPPIQTVNANFTCGSKPQVYVDTYVEVDCSSSVSLTNIKATLQYLNGGKWVPLVEDPSSWNIPTSHLFVPKKSGTLYLRVVSDGLMNQLSKFAVNLQVQPFISNVMKMQVLSLSNVGSSTSQNKVGAPTKVRVPSILGQNSQYLQRNSRLYTGFRFFFSTDIHATQSLSCELSGQAIVISQTPRAGTLVPTNTTVHGYTSC